jgi:hypothetical protein
VALFRALASAKLIDDVGRVLLLLSDRSDKAAGLAFVQAISEHGWSRLVGRYVIGLATRDTPSLIAGLRHILRTPPARDILESWLDAVSELSDADLAPQCVGNRRWSAFESAPNGVDSSFRRADACGGIVPGAADV